MNGGKNYVHQDRISASLIPKNPLLSYFEKIAHMSVVWAYVSLCVRISVAGANKVEGTMSWRAGTHAILAFNITFTRLKVKQRQFETAKCWFFSIFRLLYG